MQQPSKAKPTELLEGRKHDAARLLLGVTSRQYPQNMSEPSEYELEAWRSLQNYRGRPLSAGIQDVGQRVAEGARAVGERASEVLERHPTVNAAVGRGKAVARRAGKGVRAAAGKAGDAVPAEVASWTLEAADSVRRTGSKLSRAGLSPKRVVSLHKKRGHDVHRLADVRRLDLEQVHLVRGVALSWYYPAVAALSGAGSGLAITGGQLVTAASAGAAAAPSAGVVMGALAFDATAVLTVASRAVGHISLLHGYDPDEPSEKLFILSIVNAGTAVSASAKTAAFADISRLTQALVRGKTWEILNQSVISRASREVAKAMSVRLTKQGLGKIVPTAGIVIGGAFNWATIEGIVDGAEVAYRRRLLLEKYPQLAEDLIAPEFDAVDDEPSDDSFSVLDTVAEAGGPDLR